jgi:hypothetical protein
MQMVVANSPSTHPYYEIHGFGGLGPEDSWAMGIQEDASEIIVGGDFALCLSHLSFAPPLPNDANSCKRGHLRFREPSSVAWLRSSRTPNYDSTGQADFGNFDWFYFSGRFVHLQGAWGELEVISMPLTVDYLEKKDAPN